VNFLSASVKIAVDDKGLPAQLAKAKTAVTRTVSAIKTTFSKMAVSFKAAFDKMVRYAKWGALAIVGALTLATKAAMKQEDAQFLLAAALKISGEWTLKLQHRFEAFAASIQQVTIYGDEEVLALMQLQKSLGVTSDKLEEAAKMSIGLATATGRDVKSMAMYIALAQQGEFTMLRRYIPALRSTTDATEQLKIVTEFAAAGFKLAEERAKTTSGSLRQMWNALGDVAEVIGKALLPGIQNTAIAIKEWAEKNQARIGKWAEIVAKKVTYVKDVLWTFIKFMHGDWKQGLKTILEVSVVFFQGFAASVMVLMEDLFTSIGRNLGVWTKRGIAQGLEFRELTKEFLEGMEISGGITKEAEAVYLARAQKMAAAKLSTGYFQPVLEEAYPLIEVEGTLGRIKELAKETTVEIKKLIPPELAEKLAEIRTTAIKVGATPGIFGGAGIGDILGRQPEPQDVMPTFDFAAATAEAQQHIEWLRTQDLMTLDEKIMNLNTYMEAKRSTWAEESEAMGLLQEEYDRYKQSRIEGWDALKMSMSEFYESSMNWGARLGEVLTDAFRSMGAVVVDALMGGEDAWKNFAKMVVKQLLVMIATLMIAVALQTVFTFGANVTAGMPAISNLFSSLAAMSVPSKQTGGYIEETGLYRLHEGEKVLTKSEQSASSNIVVNITNNAPVEVTAQRSGPNTVDVFISAMATDGKLRRAIKQTVRS